VSGNGNGKHKQPTTIKCRGCGGDLVKGSPECARVEVGRIAGMDGGYEDWDVAGEPWGYMHLRCFYLSVGDPRAVTTPQPPPTRSPNPA